MAPPPNRHSVFLAIVAGLAALVLGALIAVPLVVVWWGAAWTAAAGGWGLVMIPAAVFLWWFFLQEVLSRLGCEDQAVGPRRLAFATILGTGGSAVVAGLLRLPFPATLVGLLLGGCGVSYLALWLGLTEAVPPASSDRRLGNRGVEQPDAPAEGREEGAL
jgi:hypothetical protein